MTLGADREQHFRLEDEAVADDADVLAVGQDLAQAAEEVGAVAVELLHALRQRDVEPLAEIGDLGVGLAVARLGSVERIFQRGDLLAQRGNLLVEQFDLAHRLLADLLLRVEFLAELDGALRGGLARAGALREKLLQARALAFGRFQRGAQIDDADLPHPACSTAPARAAASAR